MLEERLSSLPDFRTQSPYSRAFSTESGNSEEVADRWKELINKLAWSFGSTYGLPYSKPGVARDVATRVAGVVQGYLEQKRAGS